MLLLKEFEEFEGIVIFIFLKEDWYNSNFGEVGYRLEIRSRGES